MALAGIKKYVAEHQVTGKNMVSIVCGANMNFDRLRYIAERTELGERREAIYAVTIPEQKGAFLNFCSALQGAILQNLTIAPVIVTLHKSLSGLVSKVVKPNVMKFMKY